MVTIFAVAAALLLQSPSATNISRVTRGPDAVRVWRTDSTAYVTLRQPGHLVLLNVDAIGRIQVLFPQEPYDSTLVSAGTAIAIDLPPEAQGNPATFVAIRSRWPFDFNALRTGVEWNYQDAWLLQPTAGDPLAALLDIADRITGGRPYDYGGARYSRDGTLAALGQPVEPQVCLSCVRHGEPVAVATVAATNSVDCSNASLTNSFCGVNSGSVSISAPAPEPVPQVIYEPAPQPVYVPYSMPLFGFGGRSRFIRRERVDFPAPRPSMGVANRMAPQMVVPSPSQIGTYRGRHR
jgi:hypothetical protein